MKHWWMKWIKSFVKGTYKYSAASLLANTQVDRRTIENTYLKEAKEITSEM